MSFRVAFFAATLGIFGFGCGGSERAASAEGEVCELAYRCEEGLACVPGVGAEYGKAATDAVCERPPGIYGFVQFGERGNNSRLDEALAMIEGVYRLPRMLEHEADLEVVAHPLVDAQGQPVRCSDASSRAAEQHDCLVPNWSVYFDSNRLAKYPSFILFSLRMTGALFYTLHQAPYPALRARIGARTGRRGSQVGKDEVERARVSARNAALAIFDSFIRHAHLPFALAEMPACYQGSSGYQNPNRSWAPELDQWDPAVARSHTGRLVTAYDVNVECDPALSYWALRDSLWDKHAVSYRALTLANAYRHFRGVLPAETRSVWRQALRETGEALALPSSYETGDNHGITQSAALLQLAQTLEADLPEAVIRAWRRLGRHRLNDLVGDTVFPNDGVQVEQSPFYHNYQLALLLQVADWLDAVELDLTAGIHPLYHAGPDGVPATERLDYDSSEDAPLDGDVNRMNPSPTLDLRQTLERMVRASVHLAQPDGWVPTIGSSLPQEFRRYQEDALSAFAAGDGEVARQLLFFRSAGAKGSPPSDEERLVVFGDSGFVTMHSSFASPFPQQTHLVFNTGLPYHDHSHPDALAVHLFGRDPAPGAESGLPLLIDPGWFSYRADGRHYFESTLAHNTVHVDGENQCVRDPTAKRRSPYVDEPLQSCEALRQAAPPFGELAAGQVLRGLSQRGSSERGAWMYQSAQHTLYAGVRHRRAVTLLEREVVVVVDQVEATSARQLAQSWHVTPQAAPLAQVPAPEAGTYHLVFQRSGDEAPLFSLHQPDPDGRLTVALHYGEPDISGIPGRGWYSPADEQRDKHLVVELLRVDASQATFASVFLLGELAAARPPVTLTEPAPNRVEVQIALAERGPLTLHIENLAGGAPSEVVRVQP